jgi:hypothetical protein
MARWKLVESHYLNCGDTMWEYKETDRATGRERRKQLPVPRYLNIEDPGDWTWRDPTSNRDNQNGEIIVCFPGKGQPGDLEFFGDPTPGMIPADDEAREISASFEAHWRYKPEGSEVSYSQSMLDKFMAEKAELESKPATVEVAGLSDLIASFATMASQNQALITAMAQTHRKL